MDGDTSLSRVYANAVGAIPSSFYGAIRQLEMDQGQALPKLSHNSEFQILRLLKGGTLLSGFHFAALTYFPDEMEEKRSPLNVARLFEPRHLGAIIASFFMYKRLKKIISTEDFPFFAPLFQRWTDIGARIGLAIEGIGPGIGMIGASFGYAALGSFLVKEKKTGREYIRHLKSQKKFLDASFEVPKLAGSSTEIASQFLIKFCFGAPIAEAFTNGIERPPESFAETKSRLEKSFCLLRAWLDTIALTVNDAKFEGIFKNKFPLAHEKGALPVHDSDLKELLRDISEIWEVGAKHQWMEKAKEDLPEFYAGMMDEAAPAPSAGKSAEAASAQAASPADDEEAPEAAPAETPAQAQCKYEDLPEEVRAELTLEEFKQIETMPKEEIIKLFGWK